LFGSFGLGVPIGSTGEEGKLRSGLKNTTYRYIRSVTGVLIKKKNNDIDFTISARKHRR
jgi:hypothetical protein